ncbi:spore coat protein [Ornithinibacillus sp. BX22]|uniref:Spore coat protein n=2 Tax=Ornithinibacillus TaxID=484508 RepID=A0A923L8A0_9BACI|nr:MULTISPECIES: spore coat protein [Ornithinibacillus]MBC5638308.1 spore coat protein [Ornithinibacillus hominis]MBS3680912.1 spore coat protein [Ornithinibacillus massiliensis]
MTGMIQNMAGMGGMTDQVIATDLLISAKTGIKNYAAAITETATPEIREALREQLIMAIESHEKITNYMISKGYYHPGNMNEQLSVDMQTTQTALNLPQQ